MGTARAGQSARLLFGGGLTVGVAAILAGCLSIEQMAPPVGAEFASAGMRNGITIALLETGREVYLMDCSRCHSIEPIDRYSVGRWRDIIVRMAPESKLDASRTEALQAYVLAAHKVLAQRAATKSSGANRNGRDLRDIAGPRWDR